MQRKYQLPTWTVRNFNTVSLATLNNNTATQRLDYKFCVPEILLDSLLKCLQQLDFSVVDLGNDVLVNEYETWYFDDKNLTNFHDHRCGKLPRKKYRHRIYSATGESFVELKTKTQAGKTKKKRIILSNEDVVENILQKELGAESIEKVLTVRYKRVSFLSSNKNIKITVDRFLTVDENPILSRFVVLEIKVSHRARETFSVLKKFLHSNGIRETSFSKYCVGLCWKHDNLPKNKWKQVFKKYIDS